MPAINFTKGDKPDVKTGNAELFIILAEVNDGAFHGTKIVFPAYYLNGFPLEYQDGCSKDICTDEKCYMANLDGCPTTGWFIAESIFNFNCSYEPILQNVLAFGTVPTVESILTELEATQ